ncbi:MAG: hypothetical protein Q7J68_04915 [Thermoplasmata archaeon]|nr:hypothetical protein [Thermoplasmata archaeon]
MSIHFYLKGQNASLETNAPAVRDKQIDKVLYIIPDDRHVPR